MQVLLVPGVGCTDVHLAPFMTFLKKAGLKVRALTMPWQQPGGNAGGHTMSDAVAYVKAAIGDEDTILVGHSKGGCICEQVADEDPHVVGQVLIATPAAGTFLQWRALFALMRPRYLIPMITGAAFTFREEDLNRFFFNGHAQKASLATFAPESGWVLLQVALRQLVSSRPHRKIQTLVVSALGDAIVSRDAHRKLVREHEAEEEVLLPGAHMLEEGEAVSERIFNWMRSRILGTFVEVAE